MPGIKTSEGAHGPDKEKKKKRCESQPQWWRLIEFWRTVSVRVHCEPDRRIQSVKWAGFKMSPHPDKGEGA